MRSKDEVGKVARALVRARSEAGAGRCRQLLAVESSTKATPKPRRRSLTCPVLVPTEYRLLPSTQARGRSTKPAAASPRLVLSCVVSKQPSALESSSVFLGFGANALAMRLRI